MQADPSGLTTQKRFTVFAAAFGLSAWAMDVAATQVALPTIQSQLGLSVTGAQWLLNLSIMVLAAFVTIGGAIGDRIGRVTAFRLGCLILVGGAAMVLVGGLTDRTLVVFIGRAVEGLGAGFTIPASTGLLIDVFPPEERGAAQGKAFAYSMLATAIAPAVAGVIVQRLSWPLAYLLPIGLGVVTLVVLARITAPSGARPSKAFDVLGSLLLVVTVSALIFGFMQAGANGWGSPEVAGGLALGVLTGIVLVVVELRKSAPLIQLRLLGIRAVAIAMAVGALRFFPTILAGAFVARYAQQVLGLSPTQTGLLAIVTTLTQFVAAPIAGRILDRQGPRLPVSIGVFILLIGTLVLGYGFSTERLVVIVIATGIVGAGFAFTNPLTVAALNETPVAERGMLSGLLPLSGQFGSALAVAVITALLVSGMESRTAAGATAPAAQAAAIGQISVLVAGLTAISLVIVLALPKPLVKMGSQTD